MAGPSTGRVWTYDSWNDTFVAVDIPGGSANDFARTIKQVYSLPGGIGSEIIVAQMTKEQIGYRLP